MSIVSFVQLTDGVGSVSSVLVALAAILAVSDGIGEETGSRSWQPPARAETKILVVIRSHERRNRLYHAPEELAGLGQVAADRVRGLSLI